ncbi:MAG: immunity 70 family protein [Bilifractor sp.]|jgi:2,3-bisphosphoglycerate-dependent phosphoglycerate mutase
MSVSFWVNDDCYDVGAASFLHSFFSTVCYNLEDGKWGSRYPVLMNEFYQGSLEYAHIKDAIAELDNITAGLKKFPPDKVVWDIEDLSKQPPWGDNIAPEITDLSNYFVTNDGEDFLTVFRQALEKGLEKKAPVEIM